MKSNCQLLIIGAGAAGLGAAQKAQQSGIDYLLVEASHRVGGRGLTEELAPGIPWDLGCHWLHSGGINPLAKIADRQGSHYDKHLPSRAFYMQGNRLSEKDSSEYHQFCAATWQKIQLSDSRGEDIALSDLVDHESRWAPYYNYWQSLMTSEDVDNFSALDLIRFNDTDENWPLRDGYGRLLAQQSEGLNIHLNTAVKRIDWGGSGKTGGKQGNHVTVETSRGTVKAANVIITVSTGVLGARDIEFYPELPIDKQEAIAALPLGSYNNFAMLYDEAWPFDSDTPERIDYSNGDDINFAFKLKCSGWPYVYCAVAGRQARWLEHQAIDASEELMMSALVDIFGADIKKKIIKFRTSAWGDDPLIKGAFSASKPGHADKRKVLAEPLADCVYFAGEATSEDAFATAHGAWQSGIDAVYASSQ